jgi:hypothetical protein
MGSETGWEVQEDEDGSIIQSGVHRRPANNHHDVRNAMGWITRGVVLATYSADEDTRNGWTSKQKSVLCDVRTYGRYSRFLDKVPMLQTGHGLWDTDIRIPRSSRGTTTGADLVGQPVPGEAQKGPTPADILDGDHVLIGFLDNDPTQAVVLPFCLPHPNSNYRPTASEGHIRRIRHQGTLFEIDREGNLTIDGRGAAKEQLGANGTEVSNSGTGGKLLFITKDGSGKVTSIELNAQGQVMLGASGLNIVQQGALNGEATDPYTGLQHWQLGNASATVFVKKG